MNLIVSTCGTSVLTNRLKDQPEVPHDINEYTNLKAEDDVPMERRFAIKEHLKLRHQGLLRSTDIEFIKTKASAELNGILSLAGDRTPLDSRDVYILLHTDTWLGTAAAKVIEAKLQSYGAKPQLLRVDSLNTRSRKSFDDGLRNLVKWAADTLPGYRQAQYKVIFNLVGGFKSVQGFMQTLGMFYADEIVYIFETGSELLRIPRLPVDLDTAAQKVMTDHASLFRRLDILGPQPSSAVAQGEIPESMLELAYDITDLSPWGKLLWNAFKDSLYKIKLLDSPSKQIRFTETFIRDAAALERDRYAILNERIDDLMRYLEQSACPNPRRLDVKKLSGNPKPPSTHEADAWANADCRRIFFHYERNIALLDQLQAALH